MSESARPASIFGKPGQIGMVVRDVRATCERYWSQLGIGPWTSVAFSPPSPRKQWGGSPQRHASPSRNSSPSQGRDGRWRETPPNRGATSQAFQAAALAASAQAAKKKVGGLENRLNEVCKAAKV